MIAARNCKYCTLLGKCSHKDAPNPGHSHCIGKEDCEDYEKRQEGVAPC